MSYVESAKKRASRRKSCWNLLLIPAVVFSVVILWGISFHVLELIHKGFHPGQTFSSHSKGLGAVLAAVAPFFAVIPIAMLVGNALVWLVPPARKALESESKKIIGASFLQTQRSLFTVASIIVPVAFVIAFIGAYLPWYK